MILQEIKNIKESKKDLKKFGLTVGTVLILIGIFFIFFDKPSYVYFLSAGILLILCGIIFPSILKPLNKVWMTVAVLLGWLMTRVILTLLFYLGVTPIALIAKLIGKKFLDLKFDKSKETYWIKREGKKLTQTDFERQF